MVYARKSERKIQIYGITGKKGSGKDSFAGYIKSFNNKFTVVRFADDLKSMVNKIWGFSLDDMESQEAKARVFDAPIPMDAYLPGMISQTGLPLTELNILAHSLRELLQYFGSEYVRGKCDSYWVDRVVSKVTRLKNKVLITDCRFENEANAIRSIGGKIIRITRMDAPVPKDSHVSETLMEKIVPDLTIGTFTNKFTLQKRIAYLIALNKDKQAFNFDLNNIDKALKMYVSSHTILQCSEAIGLHGKENKAMDCLLDYYGIKKRNGWKKIHRLVNGKECSRCHSWLGIDQFGFSSRTADTLQLHCLGCRNSSEAYKRFSQINTVPKIFENTRKNAKTRGLKFDLTLQDVEALLKKQDGKCFYSGKTLSTELHSPNKLTLDRVDSSKGYTKENIILCCYTANIMKNRLDTNAFYEWVNAIYEHIGRHRCTNTTAP